eukprot:TRINITY_DN11680_c0_g1_i1.p1 TRINITY_DN11680_c0_g1~~TRINITY_DN11680_c0_g1_i1.p1  ORF type:complete len:137 (+),score=7.09 TRINITY_DN11680_c0_g1_i1:764-1174(+)
MPLALVYNILGGSQHHSIELFCAGKFLPESLSSSHRAVVVVTPAAKCDVHGPVVLGSFEITGDHVDPAHDEYGKIDGSPCCPNCSEDAVPELVSPPKCNMSFTPPGWGLEISCMGSLLSAEQQKLLQQTYATGGHN